MQQSLRPILPLRLWWWLINDERRLLGLSDRQRDQIDPFRCTVFILLHVACGAVLWVGVSWVAIAVCAASYLLRMFFITAFFHRYFSHHAFRTGRLTQFLFAVLGCTAGQRGPLWWAGHHRTHHLHADTADDPHSPSQHGMWFAHAVWFLTRGSFAVPRKRVRDLERFTELRWLERLDWLPFVAYGFACYGLGVVVTNNFAGLETSPWQIFVWGFVIATVLLYHATYTINSLAHRYGSRRYATRDTSRNNLWLALLTLGEGWHNNHHRYPVAARQGFFWWEIDPSYWLLRLLAALHLVRDLRGVPKSLLHGGDEPARV